MQELIRCSTNSFDIGHPIPRSRLRRQRRIGWGYQRPLCGIAAAEVSLARSRSLESKRKRHLLGSQLLSPKGPLSNCQPSNHPLPPFAARLQSVEPPANSLRPHAPMASAASSRTYKGKRLRDSCQPPRAPSRRSLCHRTPRSWQETRPIIPTQPPQGGEYPPGLHFPFERT